jgi:hypothetical protein
MQGQKRKKNDSIEKNDRTRKNTVQKECSTRKNAVKEKERIKGYLQKIPAAAKQRTKILLQLALLLLNTPTIKANLHINHNC